MTADSMILYLDAVNARAKPVGPGFSPTKAMMGHAQHLSITVRDPHRSNDRR